MTTYGYRSSARVNSAARGSGVKVAKRAPSQLLPAPTGNLEEDETKPLSGKPYFHVVLSKSHIAPRYQLAPSISLNLPKVEVPAVLKCGGKSWKLSYNGRKFFDTNGWGNFVKDNRLKEGDACVFELMENNQEKLVFEVQILRGDIPSKIPGQSAAVPIFIE